MKIRDLSLAAVVAVSFCSAVRAQDPLDEMYGQAVHSYFRGDTLKSESLLNEVIAAGSVDPRVYFYRGLCHSRNGNMDAATVDFEKGAQFELESRKVVNVGKALERVQGYARVEIEKTRSKARLASRAKLLEMQKHRYEESLSSGAAASGAIVVPPKVGVQTAPLSPNDPFNSGLTKGAAQPAEAVPATPTTPSTTEATKPDDVFGGNAPTSDTPASEDDPFK